MRFLIGLALVTYGLFFGLQAFGAIPTDYKWFDFWPIIVGVIGLRILFKKGQ